MGIGKEDASTCVYVRCAGRRQPDPPVGIVGHVQQGIAAELLGALEPALRVDQAWTAHRKEAQCDDLFDQQLRPVADAVGNEQVHGRVVGVVGRSWRNQLQLHLRVLAQKTANVVAQPIGGKARCTADAQAPGNFLLIEQLPGFLQVQQ
ncbi:hypothetical protein D3C81_1639780 [compost metagenome]